MAAEAPFPGEERYMRECITDVAWWSIARCGGRARRAVPGDCPGLWRLMVFLFLFLLFFGLLGFAWGLGN
ncbi:hypothetical protein E1A91_A02G015100v1 [Gossypium mustelinum]|uniref:Uncharacterized protein n=1 Tax=Gossypium mustelinum TaxID=34275 RepID=A0A5D3A1L0_GOSMU|nr:hypothetical protein E1A91_A02G015100v1 [Gossypium mustelinum]